MCHLVLRSSSTSMASFGGLLRRFSQIPVDARASVAA